MKLNKKNEKMQRKLLKRIAVGAGVATLLAGTAAVMWAKHTRRSKFVSGVVKPEQTETQPVNDVLIMGHAASEDWLRRRKGDKFAQ